MFCKPIYPICLRLKRSFPTLDSGLGTLRRDKILDIPSHIIWWIGSSLILKGSLVLVDDLDCLMEVGILVFPTEFWLRVLFCERSEVGAF